MRRPLLWSIIYLGLSGCALADEPSSDAPAQDDPLADASHLATLSFDERGLTAPLKLEDAQGALLAKGQQTLCFERVGSAAPARGAALEVLEEGEHEAVSFQRLRCQTKTPLREALPEALTIAQVQRRPQPQPPRTIALRFVMTPHASLRAQPEAQAALIEALEDELAGLGLSLAPVQRVEIEEVPQVVSFKDLEADALDAMIARAPARPPATIDVFFAGCLRLVDVLGSSSSVEGFTGRVGGGGGGSADGIFVPGLRCDGRSEPQPIDDAPAATAHIIVHELGHYLGLVHVDDPLNTMHPQPRLATARGLSAAQRARLYRHPFVR